MIVFEDYIDELEDREFEGHHPTPRVREQPPQPEITKHENISKQVFVNGNRTTVTTTTTVGNSTTTTTTTTVGGNPNAAGLGTLNKLFSPKIEIFGDYLTIRNDKLTVHESYFADNGPKYVDFYNTNNVVTFSTLLKRLRKFSHQQT
jgi:hypothetical protein